MCPDEAVYNQLNACLDSSETIEPPVDPSALVGDSASKAQPNTATLETVTSAIRGVVEDKTADTKPDPHNDDDDPNAALAFNFKQMALTPNDPRFMGKSSWLTLVETAIELKNEYTDDGGRFNDLLKPALKHRRTEFWDIRPVCWPLSCISSSVYILLVGMQIRTKSIIKTWI